MYPDARGMSTLSGMCVRACVRVCVGGLRARLGAQVKCCDEVGDIIEEKVNQHVKKVNDSRDSYRQSKVALKFYKREAGMFGKEYKNFWEVRHRRLPFPSPLRRLPLPPSAACPLPSSLRCSQTNRWTWSLSCCVNSCRHTKEWTFTFEVTDDPPPREVELAKCLEYIATTCSK